MLFNDGYAQNAWDETKIRKPEKATPERIAAAKELLKEISNIDGLPTPIPSGLLENSTP